MRRLGFHISIAIGLLALVFWQGKAWELPNAVQGLDWRVAVAVLALNGPIVALWVLRSSLVLAKLGYRLPLMSLVTVTTLGNVASALTPGGAGDVLRGVALKTRHDVPGPLAASAVLYERLYIPLLMILSLVAAGAVQALAGQPLAMGIVLAGDLVIAVACVRLYPLLAARLRPLATGDGRIRRMHGRWTRRLGSLGKVNDALAALFSDLELALRFALLTVAAYALTAVQIWLLLDAVGGEASGAQAWLAYGTASLAGMLTILPGGVGIWDATLYFVLAGHGVDATLASTTTLLVRALMTLPLGLLAIVSHLYLGRSRLESASGPRRVPVGGAGGLD